MTEERPMTIEDFLMVMEMNVETYPEFAALDDAEKRCLANFNIITGDAKSFWRDGQFLGLGGIRYIGLGEAWLLTTPEMIGKGKIHNHGTLIREAKKFLTRCKDEHNLWRVFADARISESFLKHCKFEARPKGYVWTRQ